jgi:predicted DNA-binding transcriptional regulator YafY
MIWETIRAAGKERKCVEIYYHSASSGKRNRYVMVPWSFRSPNGKLTMYAFDVEENKMKQLRCDSIQLITKLEQPWPESIKTIQYPMETSYPEILLTEHDLELLPLKDNKPPSS